MQKTRRIIFQNLSFWLFISISRMFSGYYQDTIWLFLTCPPL